ncbi:MAG: NnrU family protein [Polaromonas sp.]
MGMLILGLILFLGIHSTRIVAEGWRTAMIARLGAGVWKALYTLVSLAGLALVVWGFGLARQEPVALWWPPYFLRYVMWLLTLLAFVLLAAAYVPRNAIKARLHHPMVLGVQLWALAHLLVNGNLAHVVLFGSFLLWAVLSFRAARQRDRAHAHAVTYPAGSALATLVTVVAGSVVWVMVAFWAHGLLMDIRPV